MVLAQAVDPTNETIVVNPMFDQSMQVTGKPVDQNTHTTNKKGRRIKRYAMDDAKDALRQVMQHPKAKKSFSKRKAMVEAVFAYLQDIQRLNRFRRKEL